MRRLVKFFVDRHGSVPMEYGLIAALISVALLVSVDGFTDAFLDTYTYLAGRIGGE